MERIKSDKENRINPIAKLANFGLENANAIARHVTKNKTKEYTAVMIVCLPKSYFKNFFIRIRNLKADGFKNILSIEKDVEIEGFGEGIHALVADGGH